VSLFIRPDFNRVAQFVKTHVFRAIAVLFLYFFVCFSIAPASAQSHPGWWTVVPPESRSLVGIEWENLRNSPFGEALRGELSTAGGIALPNLPCLMNAHDFLIASPPLLAAANGGCAPVTLRTEAPAQGLKLTTYRGFDLWIEPAVSALSICQFNERVVLIGSVKSLRAAIDRSLAETRTYSPLLIQGARLARTRDLWAVATELPDPLASIFIPLEVTAGSVRNFEGGITVREGLELGAILDAGSEAGAAEFAAGIRKSIPQFPAVAKGLQVATNGSSVTLALQVPKDALQASLRREDADNASPIEPPVTFTPAPAPRASTAPPAPKAPAAPPAPKTPAVRPTLAASPAPPAPKPLPAPAAPSDAVVPASTAAVDRVKPEPQVIRIYGLDGGPREIVLPPKEP
jgi:hypothetical protein